MTNSSLVKAIKSLEHLSSNFPGYPPWYPTLAITTHLLLDAGRHHLHNEAVVRCSYTKLVFQHCKGFCADVC